MDLMLPEWGLIFWTAIIFLMLLMVPMLVALVSILKNEFKDSAVKLTWVIVVIFLPVIGPIVYFFIARNQIIKTT